MNSEAIFSSAPMVAATLCHSFCMIFGLVWHGQLGVSIISDVYLTSAALTLLSSITSTQKSGIDFLISFFFLFFIAVPSQVQVTSGVFPWFADISYRHLSLTFSLLSFCQISYSIGQSYALRKSVRPTESTFLPLEAAQYYTKWAWGLAILSILCAVLAGPTNLTVARFDRTTNSGGLTLQFLFISRSISLLSLIVMAHVYKSCRFLMLKRQNLVSIIIFLPVFVLINYPPALPRFVLFGTIIAFSCILLDYSRPKVKLSTAAVATFFLFFVFPFTKIIASGNFDITYFFSRVGTTDVSLYLLRVDFDGFMQIASSIQYLDNEVGGIRWGYNFLGVVLFFVPRGIWPGKPIDTGEIVSNALGYFYNNVACPLPAEAIMGFGVLGPVLVFMPMGYFISVLERRAKPFTSSTTKISNAVLLSITMGFIIIILRGALNGVAPQFASGFMAYTIMIWAQKNVLFGETHEHQLHYTGRPESCHLRPASCAQITPRNIYAKRGKCFFRRS